MSGCNCSRGSWLARAPRDTHVHSLSSLSVVLHRWLYQLGNINFLVFLPFIFYTHLAISIALVWQYFKVITYLLFIYFILKLGFSLEKGLSEVVSIRPCLEIRETLFHFNHIKARQKKKIRLLIPFYSLFLILFLYFPDTFPTYQTIGIKKRKPIFLFSFQCFWVFRTRIFSCFAEIGTKQNPKREEVEIAHWYFEL